MPLEYEYVLLDRPLQILHYPIGGLACNRQAADLPELSRTVLLIRKNTKALQEARHIISYFHNLKSSRLLTYIYEIDTSKDMPTEASGSQSEHRQNQPQHLDQGRG